MSKSPSHFQFHPSSLAGALLLFLSAATVWGESAMQRTEKEFFSARSLYEKNHDNFEAAWELGRACFDWAEFSRSNSSREKIALQGITACRRAALLQPNSIEGHYYLAMNLGQLARTKTLGALKLVEEMELKFKLTRDIDEKFDFAGPDRNLGLLYFEAPPWPTSVGNRAKARHHLQRAAQLSPNYPENRLNLLEAYLKWGDQSAAQREHKELQEIWDFAKKEFAGKKWEVSWTDWEKRWGKIQSKPGPSRSLGSPRSKK